MKKFLLSLFAIALAVCSASATDIVFDFVNNTYGMTRYSGTSSEYNPEEVTFSEGPVSVELKKTSGNGSRLWANGLRFYKGGSTITLSTTSKISQVVIETATASHVEFFSAEGYADGTWTGSASSLVITVADAFGTGTGAPSNIAIKTMTVTVEGDANVKKNADLKFAANNMTAVLGEAFTAPELTKSTTATVTYASSDEAVATVDATTGAVTLVAEGTVKITATAEENDEYYGGSATYELVVKAPLADNVILFSELGDEFTFENPEDIEVWQHDTRYGLKASAFKDNACLASDAVAVSPVLDLTGRVNVALDFKNAYNQYKLNGTMIAVADFSDKYAFIVVREEGATEWTKLALPTAPESFSWNYFDNGSVSLEAYEGKKIQFGFRYVSTAEIAGTWEIKEIKVTGDKNGAVEGVDMVDADAPVVFYNLQGVRVANPAAGNIYVRVQGAKATKVIF